MDHPYWSEQLGDTLPGRVAKPRISGLTMVIDTGVPLTMVRDLLQLGSPHLDFWKFGFASASVCPPDLMAGKVALCQEYGVLAYPGGTSMEIAVKQNWWKEYLEALWEGGIRVVEVSDGTIELSPRQRREIIRTARKMGFTVLSEIGKKYEGYTLAARRMAELAQTDLNSGAHYVIVEGREGGKNVGVFDAAGNADQKAVQELAEYLGPLITRLIWEAPLSSQQIFYIREFGNKVNLGNVKPLDVIPLESLRRGLRSDTLRIGLGIDAPLVVAESAEEPVISEVHGPSLPKLWTDGAFRPSTHRKAE